MVAALALLVTTDIDSPAFVWTLASFLALIAMHSIYWIVTHPVNKFWLKDQKLKGSGALFFGIGQSAADLVAGNDPDTVWSTLRNRWEYSHVVRAMCAGVAMVTVTVAVAI